MEPLEAAKDQALFREVNERLRDLNEAFEDGSRTSVFVCECANRDCMKHLPVPLAEYEEVRRVPTHFIVAPDARHIFPEVERVTREESTYFVVEKFGDAGIASIKLDPRSRHRLPKRSAPTSRAVSAASRTAADARRS
jgi:hypothetical protein